MPWTVRITMAAGLSRPTMMVSTTDMAIQPSSESTTGMANSKRAASSLRKRVAEDTRVAGAGEIMIFLTLIDLKSIWRRAPASLPGQFQDVTLNRDLVERRGFALLTNRESWPSGLRRTLGKRVYRKVP